MALMCAASVVALTAGARAIRKCRTGHRYRFARHFRHHLVADATDRGDGRAVAGDDAHQHSRRLEQAARLHRRRQRRAARAMARATMRGNTLNLRNLGRSRTLILLDGQRVAPSNQRRHGGCGRAAPDADEPGRRGDRRRLGGLWLRCRGRRGQLHPRQEVRRLQIRRQRRHLEIWRCRGTENRFRLGHRPVRRPRPL